VSRLDAAPALRAYLARVLGARREDLGISISEVARRAGVSRQAASLAERGESSAERIAEILDALNVDVTVVARVRVTP